MWHQFNEENPVLELKLHQSDEEKAVPELLWYQSNEEKPVPALVELQNEQMKAGSSDLGFHRHAGWQVWFILPRKNIVDGRSKDSDLPAGMFSECKIQKEQLSLAA